jgi:hypothetical protein
MRTRFIWPLITALVAAQPLIARAQNAPPAQIGDTYDDRHHEPAPGPTHSAEQQAGVALSQQQQQGQVDELQQLDRQIEAKAHKDTGVPIGCPPGDKACVTH